MLGAVPAIIQTDLIYRRHRGIAYLFVEPGAAAMPQECCTFAVSPLRREMVLRLADPPDAAMPGDHIDRLIQVLLDELALMPRNGRKLPTWDHPKIAAITAALTAAPDDCRTLREWALHVAMSERSLKRLMVQETGLTFVQWRRQLHLMVALRELVGGATVQSVSKVLGYGSVTAFIVMFKKALGATPPRYLVAGAVSRPPPPDRLDFKDPAASRSG